MTKGKKVLMMFLYNVDWDLEKKQIKKLLNVVPDARLIKNPFNPIADYELWVPENEFLIAWTLINHSCLTQRPSKKCKKVGLDCKTDCEELLAEQGLRWYEHQRHTIKHMII